MPKFRRHQILHVFHLAIQPIYERRSTWLQSISSSLILSSAIRVLLLTLIVVLILVGAYDTAIIISMSLVTSGLSSAAKLKVQRPPGYLCSNEPGDGCMLVSIHHNANIWQLYTGDRGIINTLLNKTMITFSGHTRLLPTFFYVAHLVQLLAMAYVAAQKGFDGIFLIFLMAMTWGLD